MLSRRTLLVFCALALLNSSAPLRAQSPSPRKTEHVIFVMTDGLRWQELFRGADASIMNKEFGKLENENDVVALRKLYWRDSLEERRAALMPFLWNVVAKQGQLYGNRDKGSSAVVTNGRFFSYPGYSETLCGFADPRIDSNDNIPNPNVTVLEWLKNRPSFSGDIGVFGAWNVISSIVNAQRSGITSNSGYDPFTPFPMTLEIRLLNSLKAQLPRVWDEEPFDAIPFETALEYLKQRKPRILYLSLGETDDWAHESNYAQYLDAAHRADDFLHILWETVQSMPEYRGNTTLIFSPDHGRGDTPRDWKSHGEKVPASQYIFMAFLGPDTPALGERSDIPQVTQSQIAATLAAFLGEDYHAAVSKSGLPVLDALSH